MKLKSRTAGRVSVVLAGCVIFGMTSCASEAALPPDGGGTSVADPGSISAENTETEGVGADSDGALSAENAVDALNVDEQAACLPGNWYPNMEEFTALRTAGLGGMNVSVESLEGSIMVTMRADGTMTTNYDQLHYLLSGPDASIETTHSGTESAEYVVTPEGASPVQGTLDVNTQVESVATIAGVQEVFDYPTPPKVFDRFTLSCSGAELTLTNPFGSLTMYREH